MDLQFFAQRERKVFLALFILLFITGIIRIFLAHYHTSSSSIQIISPSPSSSLSKESLVVASPTPTLNVEIKGEVKYPGNYLLIPKTTLEEIFLLAGKSMDGNLKIIIIFPTPSKIVKSNTSVPGEISICLSRHTSQSVKASPPRLNLNTATAAELEKLPGIGPKKAMDIIKLRKEKGKFTSIEELNQVKGIGEKTLQKLYHNVEVK